MGTDARTHLLFRPGALGDALLTVPLVARCLQAHPADTLVWYQSPWTCELPWSKILPGDLGARVAVHSFESGECAGWLALGEPGAAVHVPPAGPPASITVLIQHPPVGLANWCAAHGVRYHAAKPPSHLEQTPPHAADRLCAALDELGAEPIPVNRTRAWLDFPQHRLAHRRHPILLAPGAGSRRKQMAPRHWVELAASLRGPDRPVRYLLGPAEIERGLAAELQALDPRAQFESPATLADLVHEVGRVQRFYGHDSGPSHLAGMLGIETHVFFGPTNPAVWGPLGPNVTIHHFDPTESAESSQ